MKKIILGLFVSLFLAILFFGAYLFFDKPKSENPVTLTENTRTDFEVVLPDDIDWDSLRIELTSLLTDYIQIQTIRKDEIKAALYFQKIFQKEGIRTKLIPHPERPDKVSLVAEIGPEDSEEGIILLHHSDVVEVNPKEWTVPPFDATMKNGLIYGRGTLDMKGMGIMQLVAFLLLHRSEVDLRNKVMFLVVPDEESGGKYGAQFLLEKHEPLFDGYQYVLNEGGLGVKDFPFKGDQLFTIQTSEKGILSVEVTAQSASGHGSMPEKNYSSLQLMKIIMELQSLQKFQLTEQAEEFFKQVSSFYEFPEKFFLERIQNPIIQYLIAPTIQKTRATNAMVTNTISITGLSTDSHGINVIPGESKASLDIRYLPNTKPEEILNDLEKIAAKNKASIRVLSQSTPTESTKNTDLYEVMRAIIKDHFPEAQVSPYLSPGSTDSRYFREKGFVCYGLIPILISMEDVGTLHGKDENISLDNMVLGTQILLETILGFNQISSL